MEFKSIEPYKIDFNPIQLIGFDWMLITAGIPEKHNTMTAAWGSMGFLWSKPVVNIYIRPQRFTFQFTEENEYFTLSFFDPEYKPVLNFCGTKSGRDIDKTKASNLTPVEHKTGTTYFEEATIVLVCKKIYEDDIKPENFIDPDLHNIYPKQDYHKMYVGEIVECLVKEKK